MTVKDRIKAFCKTQGTTVSAFEESIYVSNGYVNAISKSIGIDKINTIVEKYSNINIEWLLTGKGSMFKTEASAVESAVRNEPQLGQPYYNVDFLGGFCEIYNSQVSLPDHNIIVPGFDRATLWCNVTGHSMEPQINHGDMIALRECSIKDIQYGEIYAVVLDTIRTIKVLRKGSNPKVMKYVPVNKDYDEQEFEVNRIINVFEVVGSISKFF